MNALVVDDEYSNRSLLANMLKKHCPNVTVLGDAASADLAYESIVALKPDLVFLDIKMPGQNGFDLLRRFDEINFSTIFVTGFDEYAVKAFEFNALDYILKPLDHSKLITAVEKATLNFNYKNSNIIHFINSLEEKTNFIKKLTIHEKDKVYVIDLNDVICISANRGYCEILNSEGHKYISAKPLSDYEELLSPLKNFIRVNKSYIINTNHMSSYTKGNECIIYMNGCKVDIEVSRRKKTEIISSLKENH